MVSHDHDYYHADVRNTELIFTDTNLSFVRKAAQIETLLQPLYEKSFGYKMDERLHVGLISDYNQIANGFSSQYPNNRQINYIGGALMGDYFCSTSWLATLLHHESAHNYQMNAKDNFVSSSLHAVLRNGAFTILPWIILPNTFESSFMAEGNAVLNESWHGNGGRLYSGWFKAATLMQAKAGYLTPERLYNENLYFLYSMHYYTLGGFYHYYLAEHYGIEALNHYWQEHSKSWYLPFMTNQSLKSATGVGFDSSFKSWANAMKEESELLVESQGETLVNSQFYSPLNADEEQIYFIINESGRERPELIVYNKQTGAFTRNSGSWKAGKVIRSANATYATQASGMVSPWRIWIGLYDENALLIDGSASKVIEGYLKDARTVYFDVPSSYDQNQLYVGNEYYAQVNSSVFIDENDNLYYFKQGAGKERTLYKNKTPLMQLQGHYSYVSGVDSKGSIYFIANSEHGSSLYCYDNGTLTRASSADTIVDARLIDDTHALVVSVGSDAYHYQKIALEQIDQSPFEVTLFFEKLPLYRKADTTLHQTHIPDINASHAYYSLLQMGYSGTALALGSRWLLNSTFADPLGQNALSVFALRDEDQYVLAGATYTNTQYFLHYDITAYGIADRPDDLNITDDDDRKFGVMAQASIPFVHYGTYKAALLGSYYQDYQSDTRTPISLSLALSRSEQYGVSMYPNTHIALTPYGSYDRDNYAYGGHANTMQNLFGEFYLGLNAQYSHSSVSSTTAPYNHGIKVSSVADIDLDPSSITLPALRYTLYTKEAFKGGGDIHSVFNGGMYFFSFPLSLQREALFGGYHYYHLKSIGANVTQKIHEAYAGVRLDTVFLHLFTVPISLKYTYTDDGIKKDHFKLVDKERWFFEINVPY